MVLNEKKKSLINPNLTGGASAGMSYVNVSKRWDTYACVCFNAWISCFSMCQLLIPVNQRKSRKWSSECGVFSKHQPLCHCAFELLVPYQLLGFHLPPVPTFSCQGRTLACRWKVLLTTAAAPSLCLCKHSSFFTPQRLPLSSETNMRKLWALSL